MLPEPRVRRAAIVAGLFVALFLVRFGIDRPTFIGASFLLALPVVLAARNRSAVDWRRDAAPVGSETAG